MDSESDSDESLSEDFTGDCDSDSLCCASEKRIVVFATCRLGDCDDCGDCDDWNESGDIGDCGDLRRLTGDSDDTGDCGDTDDCGGLRFTGSCIPFSRPSLVSLKSCTHCLASFALSFTGQSFGVESGSASMTVNKVNEITCF